MSTENDNFPCDAWTLCINEPLSKGYSHQEIKDKINCYFGVRIKYYCMADEQGKTFHTHIYLNFKFSLGVKFNELKRVFYEAHIEKCRSELKFNRDYIGKFGKWENTDKCGTKIEGSFEEWGDPREDFNMPRGKEYYNNLNQNILLKVNGIAEDIEILNAKLDMILEKLNGNQTECKYK